jgi:hypothetical protein
MYTYNVTALPCFILKHTAPNIEANIHYYFQFQADTMEWLFGRKMTPEEMLRKNQRALNKAMRDLDRERARMEQQEKKIIMDIKKLAKDGQMVIQIKISELYTT